MKRMIIATSIAFGLLAAARSAKAQDFVVIVNDANPSQTITAYELGRVYQRVATRWGNGLTVEPLDLVEGHRVRDRFTRTVFAKSTSEMKAWWQTKVFSGEGVPPAELSEDAVINHVLTHGGAVGYVSAGTALPSGVHRLRVTPGR